MTSKKNMLSAIVAVAMFALPANALAGHRYDDGDDPPRPYAWHDQGWHKGWLKQHRPYAVRPIEDEDDEGEHCHFRPSYQPPAFVCDDDGDDCEPANQGYGDDDYRPPLSYYQAEPPVGYSLIQQRNWLIQRRRAAYNALHMMQVRYDERAARRLLTVIHSLDARIAHDNQLLAGGGYMPAVPYDGAGSNSNYAYDPNSAYGPNYGYNTNSAFNPSYAASPALNAITGMVGPLLGWPSH